MIHYLCLGFSNIVILQLELSLILETLKLNLCVDVNSVCLVSPKFVEKLL